MIPDDLARQMTQMQELANSLPAPPRITIDPTFFALARQIEQSVKDLPPVLNLDDTHAVNEVLRTMGTVDPAAISQLTKIDTYVVMETRRASALFNLSMPQLPKAELPKLELPKLELPELDMGLVEAARHVAAIVDDVRLNPFVEAIQQQRKLLADFLDTERHIAALEPDAERLGAAGWTVPWWASINHCRDILQCVSVDKLDAVYVRHYSKDNAKAARVVFPELMKSPVLEQWRPILRQCIATYKRRQYLVTVPSLLLTFEGLLARATKQTGTKMRAPTSKARADLPPGVDRLIWASVQTFVESLYAASDFTNDPPDTLNRHWALHGRERPEYTKADCLRLFQALHSLATLAEE